MLKGTAREAAAEFFGTFILIAFGVGVVAQTVLSKNANVEPGGREPEKVFGKAGALRDVGVKLTLKNLELPLFCKAR